MHHLFWIVALLQLTYGATPTYNALFYGVNDQTCTNPPASERTGLSFGTCYFSQELNSFFVVTLLQPNNFAASGNPLTVSIGCSDATCGVCLLAPNITEGQCVGGCLPNPPQCGALLAVLNHTTVVVPPVTVIVPPVTVPTTVAPAPAPARPPTGVIVSVSSASQMTFGLLWVALFLGALTAF